MRIIEPSVEILNPTTELQVMQMEKLVETAGRTCYKSEAGSKSAASFIAKLIANGHEAMLEHAHMTVRFIVDRGVSHEIVRHRMASYAQESTRYCNYSQDKFGNELTFIMPCFFKDNRTVAYITWKSEMEEAERRYLELVNAFHCTPQEARDVLPASLKTELIMTANMREWRHFFKLRALGTTGKPHPQMQQVAVMLLKQCKKMGMAFFDDLEVPE